MSPRESCDVLPDAACRVDASAKPAHRQRRHLEEFVRDEPLTALAITVTAGFILGGGAGTRAGRSALGFVAQTAIRAVVGNLLIGMLMGSPGRGAKESENRS